MRLILRCLIFFSVAFSSSGCFSYLATYRVSTPDDEPRGIRVYAPRHYLMVDATEKKSQLVTLSNPCRAYDIRPITVLSKQDFRIELEESRLEGLSANQDSTAWLTFLQSVGDLSARAAGAAVSAAQINGSFGLESGIYLVLDGGGLQKLTVGQDALGGC